jgi:hypothetical protein
MLQYPYRLSQPEWREVAQLFGSGVSVRQIQKRWDNFARPGLDSSRFTIAERRQVAALAIDHPGEWKWIATQLGNGEHRSTAMVKRCATNILPKLASLGFEVETSDDIALLPDRVFVRGFPKRAARRKLISEYKARKAERSEQAGRGEEFRPLQFWSLETLLSRPSTK